jgi:hypothetical protein
MASRELAFIYAIGFVIRLYLILLIGVQTSNVTGLEFSPGEPNRPSERALRTCEAGIDI